MGIMVSQGARVAKTLMMLLIRKLSDSVTKAV